jgi:hypothetical protein
MKSLLKLGLGFVVLVIVIVVAATRHSSTTVPTHGAAAAGPAVKLGPPIVLGPMIAAALVENSGSQVISFTATATWKQKGAIAATASGAVNDLRPGQKRVASLLMTSPPPPGTDEAKVDVDTVVRQAATTDEARVADALVFGKPHAAPGAMFVDVEVTNRDTAPHSAMLQAGLLQKGALVGLAVGALNDIPPGATRTARLMSSSGNIPTHDDILTAVDTVVR